MPSWNAELASEPCSIVARWPDGSLDSRNVHLDDPRLARSAELLIRQTLTGGWAWTWRSIEAALMEVGWHLLGDFVDAHSDGAGLLFRPPKALRHLSLPLLLHAAHSRAERSADPGGGLTDDGLRRLVRAGPFRYVHWSEPAPRGLAEEESPFGIVAMAGSLGCLLAHGITPAQAAEDKAFLYAREQIDYFWRAFGDAIEAIKALGRRRGVEVVAPWGWDGHWTEAVEACLTRRDLIVGAHAVRSVRGGNASLAGVPRIGTGWPALAPAYRPFRYRLHVPSRGRPQATVHLSDLWSHIAGGQRVSQCLLMACESRSPCERLMAATDADRTPVKAQGRPIPIGVEPIYRGIEEFLSGAHTSQLLGHEFDYLAGNTAFFTGAETASLVAWWASRGNGAQA